MEEKKSILSQETLIPIGFVCVIVAAIWFMATMSSSVGNNTYRIEKVEYKLENVATKDDLNTLEKNLRELVVRENI